MDNLPVEEIDYSKFGKMFGRTECMRSSVRFREPFLEVYSESVSPSIWIFDYSRQRFYHRLVYHLEGVDPRDFSFPLEEIKK